MATVPKGPGQAESNPRGLNVPGLYYDPESGVRTHVSMPAAADALVHTGWQLLKEGQELTDDDGNVLPDGALKALLAGTGPLAEAPAEKGNKSNDKED